jgi:hypothetical protein
MALNFLFRRPFLLVLAPIVFSVSIAAGAQSPYFWIREHNAKSAFFVTKDPRFARDMHRFLAPKHEGWDLARLASAYLSEGSDDDVRVSPTQVTARGCAPHAGECAILWSSSRQSPVLAFCFMEPDLWIYISSESDPSIPKELLKSIRSWRADPSDNPSTIHPQKATIVTRDGRRHPIALRTLFPVDNP